VAHIWFRLGLVNGAIRCAINKPGKGLPVLSFGGGDFITPSPFPQVTSANLTPDPSGISYYDENLFLKIMHTGMIGARKLNPIMPWWYFGQGNILRGK